MRENFRKYLKDFQQKLISSFFFDVVWRMYCKEESKNMMLKENLQNVLPQTQNIQCFCYKQQHSIEFSMAFACQSSFIFTIIVCQHSFIFFVNSLIIYTFSELTSRNISIKDDTKPIFSLTICEIVEIL